MLTRGQQIVVDVNDTVVIDCQFQETSDDRFNLFDNPVHWTKSQLNERSRINMMVNLIKPFSLVDQGRLRVSFAGTTPNYTMTLVIARTYLARSCCDFHAVLLLPAEATAVLLSASSLRFSFVCFFFCQFNS